MLLFRSNYCFFVLFTNMHKGFGDRQEEDKDGNWMCNWTEHMLMQCHSPHLLLVSARLTIIVGLNPCCSILSGWRALGLRSFAVMLLNPREEPLMRSVTSYLIGIRPDNSLHIGQMPQVPPIFTPAQSCFIMWVAVPVLWSWKMGKKVSLWRTPTHRGQSPGYVAGILSLRMAGVDL